MAIQVRRGYLKDFDPTKMLPGEWAVSIDSSTENQIVWMCFAPGVCKRIGTYEDFQNMIDEINGEIISEYQDAFNVILDEVNVLSREVSTNADEVAVMHTDIKDTLYPQIEQYLADAELHATNSANSAEEAKTYAEEAKQYRDEAQQIAGFDVVDVYSRIDLNKQTIGYQKKNLLKNNLEDTTSNGISCVVNEDKSVTLNGKNNGSSRSYFGLGETLDVLPAGEYYFNIDDGSLDDLLFDVSITLSYVSNPNEFFTNESYSTTKTKAIFKLIEPAIIRNANIIVNLNATLDNVTVYPRVYPANIIDYGYEPYVENVDTRLSNAENKFDEYLPLSGGKLQGLLTPERGVINHSWASGINQQGYLYFATITIPASYMDSPIEFDIITRNAPRSTKVSILFAGVSGSDPSLKSFTKIGPHNVYIHKRATSSWDIYVQTKSVSDMVAIANLTFGHQFVSRAGFLMFDKEFVAELPNGYIEAKVATVDMVATGIEGVTVWQNASPGAIFAGATINITAEAAQMYRRYEVLYLDGYSNSLAGSILKTTGILPFGTMCSLSDAYPTLNGTIQNCGRRANVSVTQVVFEDAIAPGATVNANWYCIPYRVIFYP